MVGILIAIVLTILVFAVIGLVSSLIWIFSSPDDAKSAHQDAKPARQDAQPILSDDVAAARRLIKHLRLKNEINDADYHEFREFLERKFPGQTARIDLKPKRESELAQAATESSEPVDSNQIQINKPPRLGEPPGLAEPVEAIIPNDELSPESTAMPSESVVITESVEEQKESSELVMATTAKPAPWDIPDPPAPTPRRSFGELMSGFMEEKNMRWGELTSGILIVLSAVGLVVSLREELRNTIPYFSALLFMLITAAIHGAGIYTLKKWKLRNTSRGTLVIGLLLVPLNFVAACVLSDRRALNDPWLWTAILVGLTGFSLMTWWSSKHLLRRGQLPMTLAIMGCGIGALLLNRTIESASSSFHYLLFSLPVVASFLIGTCTFDPRQWVRERWTERAINRMWLFLGVSVFAIISALSLIVVRADSKMVGLVSLSPIVSVVCLVISWLGSIAYRGSTMVASVGQANVSAGSANEIRKSVHVGGLSLKVLGLILLGLSLIASISNPSVFVVNALLSTVGLIAMFIHQRESNLLPIAWSVFALGALMAINVAITTFGFDQWATVDQLYAALINGKSGLCLLIVGIAVGSTNAALKNWIPNLKDPRKFVIQGWITGGVIFLAGCVIALVASVVHRDNVFDVMMASGLLMIAAIGLLTICVLTAHKGIEKAVNLPHFASIVLLGALGHAMLWNPTIANWIVTWTGEIKVAWVGVFAIHSAMLVGLGWYLNHRQDEEVHEREARANTGSLLTHWGAGSALILTLGSLTLVPNQSGWATSFALVACGCWFLIGKVWHLDIDPLKSYAAAPFVVATGLAVSVAIAELVSRTAWCPSFAFPEHWLVQLVGLSVWSIAWSMLSGVLRKSPRWRWLECLWKENRWGKVDLAVLFVLVFVIGGFVCDALMPGTAQELSETTSLVSNFGLGESPAWMIAALASVSAAMLVSLFVAPTSYKGAALVGLWLLAWAFGAESFGDSKSVASAIRWLLPIGGIVGAGLIAARRPIVPVWAAMRNRLALPGRSYWSKSSTQQLINFALTIVAGVVLLISTVTVSQFLLHGASSLGGPSPESWFSRIPPEVSYGAPIALIVATFLLYAVSEKRSWLATVGSAVFQYFVILAVVLLFLSPHESLASTRFVNILTAVSLGMTGYGFLWFWLRDRIEGEGTRAAKSTVGITLEANATEGSTEGNQVENRLSWMSQIEVHTLLNGFLITSLAVLAMGRFFWVPDQPGAWISSVGSLLGVIAWAAFGVLAFCVWRDTSTKGYSTGTWVWLTGWMGLILVGLTSAVVDRNFSQAEDFIAWLPYRVVMVGALVVGLVQAGLIWWLDLSRKRDRANAIVSADDESNDWNSRKSLSLPVLLTGSLALTFAVRGAWLNLASFWLYVGVIVVLTILATLVGWMLRDGKLSFVSAATAIIGVSIVVLQDLHGWFTGEQPYWFNLMAIVLSILALAWSVYYVYRRQSEKLPRSFVRLPNVVMVGGAVWIFCAALLQFGMDSFSSGSASSLDNPLGIVAFLAVAGLVISSLWNDHLRLRVADGYLLTMSLAITLASVWSPSNEWLVVNVMLAVACVVAVWGIVWLNRAKFFGWAKQVGAPQTVLLENSMRKQLPIYSLIFGGLVLIAALIVIFQFENRGPRYFAAAIPFALAVGLGTQSNQNARRWLQILTLLLITVGVLFLAWADLSWTQSNELPLTRLLVRSLIVLAGAMFVYGGLVSRWVRPGDTWLKSLREMAVVTCGLAMVCLVLVIGGEFSSFVENVGCGLMVGESVTVAVLVAGMIVGLIIIALRPENDPFALSLEGRMGYVYAAEFVALALISHLYFSMPWLFQIGIKDYWPYIMMGLCFGGVGIAHVLEQRNLTVLGRPLFNSAAALPLIVAVAIFGVHSEANLEMVMLTVGLAYLMISFTHKSLLSGVAAIVFGNLALWMLFNRTDFSFLDHPQLWLIPPAVSTLIASQLSRHMLKANQLSAIRYISITVIYVSSTMEVFISGIGENLWPPVVLAILSVIGIMSGIMLRVKSFLYFGSLFLLMAMITMVAHAQQSLGHVWPWWAFGIGLGIAILVMFGLFEKRKKEMKSIANQLEDWES